MNRSASIIQKWWKKHISIKPPKKSIKKIQISKEAEKSCNEWLGTENSPMRTWLINAIMDSRQHRDIGKVLAYVAESHVIKWLETKSGRPIKSVIGESYDGKTNDTKPPVRIQIKFRMNYWHCETTRRNCKKIRKPTAQVMLHIKKMNSIFLLYSNPAQHLEFLVQS